MLITTNRAASSGTKLQAKADRCKLQQAVETVKETFVDSVSFGSRIGSAIATPAATAIGSTAASLLTAASLPSILLPPLGLWLIPKVLDRAPKTARKISTIVGHRLGQGVGGAIGVGVGIPTASAYGIKTAITGIPKQEIELTRRQQHEMVASDFPKKPAAVELWQNYKSKRLLNHVSGMLLGAAAGAVAGLGGGFVGGIAGALVGGSLSGALTAGLKKHPRAAAVLGAALTTAGAWAGATQNGPVAIAVGALAGAAALGGLSHLSFEDAHGDGKVLKASAEGYHREVEQWRSLNPLPPERDVVFSENEIEIGGVSLDLDL